MLTRLIRNAFARRKIARLDRDNAALRQKIDALATQGVDASTMPFPDYCAKYGLDHESEMRAARERLARSQARTDAHRALMRRVRSR